MYNLSQYINDLSDPDLIQAVWEKAIVVDGFDPDMYRQDTAKAWIARDAYGDTSREYGWTIDHIFPVSKGGTNVFANLRPMNWRNNISKGDDFPRYTAVITSNGNKNIEQELSCTVRKDIQERLSEFYSL